MKPDIVNALEALNPGAVWSLVNNPTATSDYECLVWQDRTQKKPTEDEINAKIAELEAAEPLRLLRVERNKRLAECDWIVTKYAEYGYNIPKEWRTYRQALRDLPSISYRPELDEAGNLKMDSVAWPTLPE